MATSYPRTIGAIIASALLYISGYIAAVTESVLGFKTTVFEFLETVADFVIRLSPVAADTIIRFAVMPFKVIAADASRFAAFLKRAANHDLWTAGHFDPGRHVAA